MMKLFFADFKRFVKSEQFKADMLHPVLYWENDLVIWFYKPVGSFIYYSMIDKALKPEEMDIKALKMEFNATEIPEPLNTNSLITMSGTLS